MWQRIFLSFVLFFFVVDAQAQPDIKHSIYFKQKYCNTFFNQTGVIMYGHSNGNAYGVYIKSNNGIPYQDSYFCKLNAQYDTVWTRRIGGSYEDILETIRELPNGNMLLAGYTSSYDGDVWYGHSYSAREIWMVEVDTLGNIKKGKTFGGGHGSELTDVIVSSDGYIYLAGNTIADDYDFACTNYGPMDGSAWVAKYDTAFNKVWINMYVGNEDDGWPTIKEIAPNRFIIGYLTNSTSIEADPINAKGAVDLLAIYIDHNGSTLWKKRYGSAINDGSRKSVVDPVTKDIYFIGNLGGPTNWVPNGDISHISGSIWIHKIDTLGNIKGSKAYGAATDLSYTQDAIWYDGGLYVFGWSQGEGGDMDTRAFTPPPGAGGYIMTWIGLIDTNVNLTGKKSISLEGGISPYNCFTHKNNLNLTVYMGTYTNPYKCDTANIVTTVYELGKAPLGVEEQSIEKTELFELSPNPAGNEAVVSLKTPYEKEIYTLSIKNMQGQEILQEKIKGYKLLQTSSWPPGQYLITLRNEKGISQTKILSKK